MTIQTQPRLLVITPVKHISGVVDVLEAIGNVTYLEDPSEAEVIKVVADYDAIYTNPNKSKVYIGKNLLDVGIKLKVICTASTGTNHIDMAYASARNLPIIALTEERETIDKISSTAELAFPLTLAGLRRIVQSHNAVLKGEWDYTKYIGRQMNYLTIGVLGYGRLGALYCDYCRAFGARTLVYDPYKLVDSPGIEQVEDVNELLEQSDVVSIHVHVTEETLCMVNSDYFDKMKSNVLFINTSRGDIVDEKAMVNHLINNPASRVAVDVLTDEIRNRLASPLLAYATCSDQVIITPHIGGMTQEAQEIAYGHAADLLEKFFAQQ